MVSTVHPALLLMRDSPSQIFCANTLFRGGVIDGVFIEEGSIGEPDGAALTRQLWRYGPVGIWQRIRRDRNQFDGHTGTLLDYYLTRFRTTRLVNRQAQQEAQLLGAVGHRLDPGLRVGRGASINGPQCRQLIQEGGYRFVCVFGTGLLKDELLAMEDVTFVNLHQGWLPRFRGEGIIAALAEEGIEGLGVTVHVIDRGIDTGPILYQERLMVEAGDNAHTIALKATVRGTALFQRVCEDAARGALQGTPQVPDEGRCYSSRVLKTRYRMRLAASRALRAASAQTATRPLWLKRAIARFSTASGLTVLSRRRHGHRLRLLMYHGVLPRVAGPSAFGSLFLDLEAFSRHLRYLVRAFTVISFDEALACLEDRRPFPERALVLTFDDGYQHLMTHVLPLAKQFRVPLTVFLPAGDVSDGACVWSDALRVLIDDCVRERTAVRVDEELVLDGRTIRDAEAVFLAMSHRITELPAERAQRVIDGLLAAGRQARVLERYPEYRVANWDEWRAALSNGILSVGSHGWTHRNLANVAPETCREDLQRSRVHIEQELSRPCRMVAYPYGAWNPVVADAARRAGYEAGVTTEAGLNAVTTHPWALRRDMVGDKGHWALFCARVAGLSWLRRAGT